MALDLNISYTLGFLIDMLDKYAILDVKARQIIDSRGNPTVECDVVTKGGFGRASVPSGKSKGKHEAVELRDGGKEWNGLGVSKAVDNVNKIIAMKIIDMDSRDQEGIDFEMISLDGTPDKSRLGANAMLSVSMAVAVAAANTKGVELYNHLNSLFGSPEMVIPVPFFNIINGGEHAGNKLAIQEFMIAPVGVTSFSDALRVGSEIYHTLRELLIDKYGRKAVNVGDEGGFAPPMKKTKEALDMLVKAIEKAGYSNEVRLSIDAAASTFFNGKYYVIDGKRMKSEKLLKFYERLVNDYPIINIEDPFQEEDFESFSKLVDSIGKDVQITGDDIFTTNPARIKKGVMHKSANALLLKLNQIGTLTEAFSAARVAFDNKWFVMVSHRSGETEDTFIADLAVALSCGEIKSGAPARGERTAKYNRLLRIEEESGLDYAGKRWFV